MASSRLFTFIVVLVIYALLELYIFSGIRHTFKNPTGQKVLLGVYVFSVLMFVIGIITLFTSFSNGYSQVTWWPNLIIGLNVTFLFTKLFFALLLLVIDVESLISFIISKFSETPLPSPQRRKILKQLGVFVAAIPFSAYLYGVLKGRYDYRIHRVTLRFPDLPTAFDGYRIAQISDVHSGSFDNYGAVKAGIDKIQKQNPDLILFTGDMINNLAEEIEH